jgi:hypothetical protein
LDKIGPAPRSRRRVGPIIGGGRQGRAALDRQAQRDAREGDAPADASLHRAQSGFGEIDQGLNSVQEDRVEGRGMDGSCSPGGLTTLIAGVLAGGIIPYSSSCIVGMISIGARGYSNNPQ